MGEVGHHAVGNTMCIPNVGMVSMAAMCCVKDLGEDAGFLARSAEQIEFASFVAAYSIVAFVRRCRGVMSTLLASVFSRTRAVSEPPLRFRHIPIGYQHQPSRHS